MDWTPKTRKEITAASEPPESTTEVYSRDWPGGKGPSIPGIGVSAHDYIDIKYDDSGNISGVKYYIGGPDGVLVSELILTWAGDNLLTVRRLNLNVPANPA